MRSFIMLDVRWLAYSIASCQLQTIQFQTGTEDQDCKINSNSNSWKLQDFLTAFDIQLQKLVLPLTVRLKSKSEVITRRQISTESSYSNFKMTDMTRIAQPHGFQQLPALRHASAVPYCSNLNRSSHTLTQFYEDPLSLTSGWNLHQVMIYLCWRFVIRFLIGLSSSWPRTCVDWAHQVGMN